MDLWVSSTKNPNMFKVKNGEDGIPHLLRGDFVLIGKKTVEEVWEGQIIAQNQPKN